MLMTVLQMVNHLNIKKNSTKTPAQPGNELDANRPSVPDLNGEVTIPLNMKKNLIYQ